MFREVRTDPFIFRWAVHAGGYKWAKGGSAGKAHLIPREELRVRVKVRELTPGLFRELADLRPTPEEIETFAGEYGSNLSSTYEVENDLVVRADGTASWGTSLESWQAAIDDMKVLVGLWDDIREQRMQRLRKVVDWSENGVGYNIAGRHVNLAHVDVLLTVPLRRFARGDVLLPAQYALQKEINRRLANPRTATVPILAWTPDDHQRLIFVPSNFLAALYLQFAQAVTEEFRLRACAECGKYFQVGPGANRADRQTCSDKCRQKRKRKA